MTRMSKPSMKRSRRKNNNNGNRGQSSRQNRSAPPLNLPRASTGTDVKPQFNPTWNPQYLKVARIFQYSAPATDFGGGYGKIQDPAVGSSATVLTYNSGVMTFALGDIPGLAEFSTLFDQYKIASVKLEFQYISASEAPLSTSVNPDLQICTFMGYEDNDDATAPTATNAGWQFVLQSGRATRRIFPQRNNTFTYVLKPKVLQADLDTAGTTLARSLGNPWLDPATTDAKYFGFKWIMQANPAPTTYVHQMRINATYFTEWRSRQ